MPKSNIDALLRSIDMMENRLEQLYKIEVQVLTLEQERDLFKALAQAALEYILQDPCNPDIHPQQLEAYNKLQDQIEMCKQFGIDI